MARTGFVYTSNVAQDTRSMFSCNGTRSMMAYIAKPRDHVKRRSSMIGPTVHRASGGLAAIFTDCRGLPDNTNTMPCCEAIRNTTTTASQDPDPLFAISSDIRTTAKAYYLHRPSTASSPCSLLRVQEVYTVAYFTAHAHTAKQLCESLNKAAGLLDMRAVETGQMETQTNQMQSMDLKPYQSICW